MGIVLAELTEVHAGYGDTAVLRGVSLDVRRGQVLVLLGHSGVGKSTLLRLLDGTLTPARGRVRFPDGPPRRGVALQAPMLFDWLSVRDNIALGAGFGVHRHHVDDDRLGELAGAFGLGGLLRRYPDELSGGQAQRVSLARALAVGPDLLLLDEPLSALDPATRAGLQDWLAADLARRGTTTVLVTHDIDEALRLGDVVHLLAPGGDVRHTWTPAALPPAERVALRERVRAAYDLVDAPLVGAGHA